MNWVRKLTMSVDYWEASGAAQTIVDALRELSRRVVEGKRKKIVLKLSASFHLHHAYLLMFVSSV